MPKPANRHLAAIDDGRTLTIDVVGHRASITGAGLEPTLKSALVAHDWQFRPTADGRVTRVSKQRHFFKVKSADRWTFQAGLLGRVVAQLERDGFGVMIRDRTGLPSMSAAQRALLADPELDDFHRGILTAAATSPRGQFTVCSAEAALVGAAILCNLWINKRILIIAPNKRHAIQVAAQLRSLIAREIGTIDNLDTVWAMEHWLLVMPVQSFAHFEPPADQWDVIICLDTALLLGAKANRQARRMTNSLRYGFAIGSKPSDKLADLMIRSVFGPPTQEEPNPAPDVEVHFATPPSTPQPKLQDPLARKRQAIWRNAARNHAIAEIARALVHHDLASLWRYGLLLHADESWFHDRNKVCLCVESLEHARELAKLLPEWTIRDATVPNPERLTSEDTNHLAIKTSVCAHEDGLYTDVLIRADGTASHWEYTWEPAVTLEKRKPRALVMIDLRDDSDVQAEADTLARVRGYESHGWATYHVPASHDDQVLGTGRGGKR